MNGRMPKLIAATLLLMMAVPSAALAAPGGNGKGSGAPAASQSPAATDKTKGGTKVEATTTVTSCPEIPVEPATPEEETTTEEPAEETTEETTEEPAEETTTEEPAGETTTEEPAEETTTEEPAEETTTEEPAEEPAEEPTCGEDSAPVEEGKGQATSAAAHAKVGARLQAALDAGKIGNETARVNVEAVIAKMLGEANQEDPTVTEEEALVEIEEAIEAEAETATAAELDVLAEVQVRQGKKTEAKETLKARLQKNPNTKAAYEALLTLEAEAGEKQDLDTFVSGKKVQFDVRPTVREGRTLSPIRALVEAVGAEVKWDGAARTVTITKGETTIVLTIGSNIALINGEEVELEVSAQIIDDRTLIPARAVVESLGFYVSWLAEHRSILITEQPVEE